MLSVNDSKKRAMLVDETSLNRMITRIAHEIVEKVVALETLALIGIWTRGVHLAHRIAETILRVTSTEIPVGTLDISFYRDDVYGRVDQPIVKNTDIPFNVNDKTVVIIDDVLYTGRTVRAAMDAIMDYGRPKRIMLAVLIDRGHRELPIRADIVGKNVPTRADEMVRVHMKEIDGQDEAVLCPPPSGQGEKDNSDKS
jgi:pyrimidine operon attenuation protein/uracil phosphoribosyltransferase